VKEMAMRLTRRWEFGVLALVVGTGVAPDPTGLHAVRLMLEQLAS
jgi:hypothetical protein